MRAPIVLTFAVLAGAACQTIRPDPPEMVSAVRFGVEACERAYLDGLALEDALAVSAKGHSFERVGRPLERWTHAPRPWRLSGVDVFVGMDAEGSGGERCEVLAIDGGGAFLRDVIMAEHLSRTDRVWTTWSTGGGGARAVCTSDRVPEGKSLQVVARAIAIPSVLASDIVSASADRPPEFKVSVVNKKACDRNA